MSTVFTSTSATADVSAQTYLPVTSADTTHTVVLAQFDDIDILADISGAWSGFVQSGQIWALIVGVVIGYLIRGITTY